MILSLVLRYLYPFARRLPSSVHFQVLLGTLAAEPEDCALALPSPALQGATFKPFADAIDLPRTPRFPTRPQNHPRPI